MKIQCPKCNTKYNIDITKIPEIPPQGIRTTCPKCKAQIPIRLGDIPAESAVKKGHKEAILPCPRCGHINVTTDKCSSCGVVFSDEEKSHLAIYITTED